MAVRTRIRVAGAAAALFGAAGLILDSGSWFMAVCRGSIVAMAASLALLPSKVLLSDASTGSVGPSPGTRRVLLVLYAVAIVILTAAVVTSTVEGD